MNVIDIRRGTFVAIRSFCPNCKIERTHDPVGKPCECMARPERIERERNRRIERAWARVFEVKA